MKKLLLITLAAGCFVVGKINGAAIDDRDTRVVTREDKYNNEDQEGAWSMLSHWIEQRNLKKVKEIVPDRINRELQRNFPDKPSDNLTAYDIAKFHYDNLPANSYNGVIQLGPIVDYLMPDSILNQQPKVIADMIRKRRLRM